MSAPVTSTEARTRRSPLAPIAFSLALLPLAFAPAARAGGAAVPAGSRAPALRVSPVRTAVVDFGELARQAALDRRPHPPVRPLLRREDDNESGEEPGANILGPPAPPWQAPSRALGALVASPSPTTSFIGLDDIPMVDSSYIVIPPDVGGAVGPSRILEGLNNNYRVLDKATGAMISTVGTATFWNAAVSNKTLLNGLTDPRTVYDPYNNRWIVAMQTVASSADILIGVSATSDPAGAWFLYSFNTGVQIDFPNLGFNKNWIVVAINRYSAGGAFQRGITLVVDYPQARTGTGVGTIFTQASGSHFCSAPCLTYSATSDTEYLVTHLSSPGATYTLDRITGTPSAPVYTAGGALTRSGGGWAQPSGNLLPQSAPVAGASACGATPCPLETQDSQVRSGPVFRGGDIWYAQTVGLPSVSLTHTGVQWTRITTPGGGFVDGGRIEDAGATSTNGGKWYAFAHLAVNAAGDMMLGFSQFSSAQHPAAGYAMRLTGDAPGTLRDPIITHAGDDYYHKTFSTVTGRNRWGDFSSVAVDPDDVTLWSLQQYAKSRTSTDDGNTGANGSKWGTWWAAVGTVLPTVTIAPGPSVAEGNSGTTPVGFTVNLSAASAQTVTVFYQTSDGTATSADNDYQPVTSSVAISPGLTSAPISINGVGDTNCESDESFNVILTSATNAVVGLASGSSATLLNDDARSITASAGTGGSISPSGAVPVACFANQGFTITAGAGFHVADVLVDGSSVGAVGTYTFTGVTANHTIAASFTDDAAPSVSVLAPNGGESLAEGAHELITWSATDNLGVTRVDLKLSRTGAGGPFDPLADDVPNTGSYDWVVTTPATTDAFVQVVARDAAANVASDASDAAFEITGTTGVDDGPVTALELLPVRPNPLGASGVVSFALPARTHVRVTVEDVQGRQTALLADGAYEPGRYHVPWRTAGAATGPGLYFIRMDAGGRHLVRRAVVIR
jgi:hypothetical protein